MSKRIFMYIEDVMSSCKGTVVKLNHTLVLYASTFYWIFPRPTRKGVD